MNEVFLLTERDLRQAVSLDSTVVDCIEDAFRALATQAVIMPDILRLDIAEHRGEVDVKTAYIPGLSSFAIKISPGFFNNPQLGLPSTSGMMVLLSATTGMVQAVLLDNGYLTDVRTAAAGAVAARHLSREDASIVGIMGAGTQARLQLAALTCVRPIREARIWARDADKARAAAARLTDELGLTVAAYTDPESMIRGTDIVVTTTPATTPIVMADWLEPGQHVITMGSDAEHKNELDPKAIIQADLYVADSLRQTRRLGELHHAIAGGMIAADADFVQLGEVVAKLRPGRSHSDQLIISDLTGTGIQDTAIANLAYGKARSAGLGLSAKTA